jgi:hypothetical protein
MGRNKLMGGWRLDICPRGRHTISCVRLHMSAVERPIKLCDGRIMRDAPCTEPRSRRVVDIDFLVRRAQCKCIAHWRKGSTANPMTRVSTLCTYAERGHVKEDKCAILGVSSPRDIAA